MKTLQNILDKLKSSQNYIEKAAAALGFSNLRLYNAKDNNLHFLVDTLPEVENSLEKAEDFKLLLEEVFGCSVFIHISTTLKKIYLEAYKSKSILIDSSYDKVSELYKGYLEFNELSEVLDEEEDLVGQERATYVSQLRKRLSLSTQDIDQKKVDPSKVKSKSETGESKIISKLIDLAEESKLTEESKDVVRADVIYALEVLCAQGKCNKRIISLFIKSIDDPNTEVNLAAIKAIGAIGNAKAASNSAIKEKLIEIVNSPSSSSKKKSLAFRSLLKLGFLVEETDDVTIENFLNCWLTPNKEGNSTGFSIISTEMMYSALRNLMGLAKAKELLWNSLLLCIQSEKAEKSIFAIKMVPRFASLLSHSSPSMHEEVEEEEENAINLQKLFGVLGGRQSFFHTLHHHSDISSLSSDTHSSSIQVRISPMNDLYEG